MRLFEAGNVALRPANEIAAPRSIKSSSGEHGWEQLSYKRRLYQNATDFDKQGLPIELLDDVGQTVGYGRVDRDNVDGGNTQSRSASGFWSALNDLDYTCLWSESRLRAWNDGVNVTKGADSYTVNIQESSILITLDKDSIVNNAHAGQVVYQPPSKSLRGVNRVVIDWELFGTAGQNWTAELVIGTGRSFDSEFFTQTIAVANGSVQTGTHVWTGATSNLNWFGIRLVRNNVANITYTDETGFMYLKLSGIRLLTADVGVTTVKASDIVKHIVEVASTQSPNMIHSSTDWIVDSEADVLQASFTDVRMSEVVKLLTTYVSSVFNGFFRAAVWEDRMLRFGPIEQIGSRTWDIQLPPSKYVVSRSLSNYATHVRVVYRASFDNELGRSEFAINQELQDSINGIRIDAVVNSARLGEADGLALRDVALKEAANKLPVASIVLDTRLLGY